MLFVKGMQGLDSFCMSQKEFAKAYYTYDEIDLSKEGNKPTMQILPMPKYDATLYLCNDQYILLQTQSEVRIAYDAELFQLVAVAKYMVEKEHFSITD